MIHVLFKTEDYALQFQTQLLSEKFTINSPLNGLTIEYNLSDSTSKVIERIFYEDYNPNDSNSPNNTITHFESFFSLCSKSTDEFKFQRIEAESFFGGSGKAES